MADDVTKTSRPKQKVLAATLGSGAGSFVAVILVWLLKKWGLDVPANVEDAITGLISLLFAGGLGWATPPGGDETSIVVDGKVRSALRTLG